MHTATNPNHKPTLDLDPRQKSNFKGSSTTRAPPAQTEARLLAQNQRSHVNSILRQDFEKKLA
jgi:hypothetical protein